MGCSLWGHKEPDMTEATEHTRVHLLICNSKGPKPCLPVTLWSLSSSSVNKSSFQTKFWNLSQQIIMLSMMIFLFMVTFFFPGNIFKEYILS